MNRLKAIVTWFSKPAIVFYLLPALMALLVAGTVAQRYIGLYDAHKMFFSSFILWLGPVPLPGGHSLIAIIAFSLLLNFLFFTKWSLKKAGIHISHLGVLVLLFGGFITAFQAEEGYMLIPEGESANTVLDYHQRELVISKNGYVIQIIPHQNVKSGKIYNFDSLTLQVHETCRNCGIIKREQAGSDYGAPFQGMARFMALISQQPEKEDEANLYGATIGVTAQGNGEEGTYIIFEAMPAPLRIEHKGDAYEILYRKEERRLPFTLKLENFEEKLHPGTAMARAYHSDIIVEEEDASWPVRIEMNQPLRHKGYTFFQSSFSRNPAGTATILTVVKNSGWLFPYIGTAIIAAGLLLHVLMTAFYRGRKS